MSAHEPTKTIDLAFAEFLADQATRLSNRTFRQYESIIGLYVSYLESYWPDRDEKEYSRITGAGGTYCGTHDRLKTTSRLAESSRESCGWRRSSARTARSVPSRYLTE
ncbi:MAG: hypothetical protein U1E05_15570 [Patescibacteria group bacterium]|nr:hypothetical protein [Patescibacteria group bacterium]